MVRERFTVQRESTSVFFRELMKSLVLRPGYAGVIKELYLGETHDVLTLGPFPSGLFNRISRKLSSGNYPTFGVCLEDPKMNAFWTDDRDGFYDPPSITNDFKIPQRLFSRHYEVSVEDTSIISRLNDEGLTSLVAELNREIERRKVSPDFGRVTEQDLLDIRTAEANAGLYRPDEEFEDEEYAHDYAVFFALNCFGLGIPLAIEGAGSAIGAITKALCTVKGELFPHK